MPQTCQKRCTNRLFVAIYFQSAPFVVNLLVYSKLLLPAVQNKLLNGSFLIDIELGLSRIRISLSSSFPMYAHLRNTETMIVFAGIMIHNQTNRLQTAGRMTFIYKQYGFEF